MPTKHLSAVDELLPDSSGKIKTQTCSTASHRDSLRGKKVRAQTASAVHVEVEYVALSKRD